MPIYRFAGLDFDINCRFERTKDILRPYLCESSSPILTVDPSLSDIEEAAKKLGLSQPFAESHYIHRALSSEMILHGGFMLHSSAIRCGGGAYCFIARSGVGKSTHAGHWISLLGERAEYINDDKPFVRRTNGIFSVYGSPWRGKHKFGGNISAPLAAICYIVRDTENYVLTPEKSDAFFRLFEQTIRPADKEHIVALLDLLGDFISSAPVYEVHCTPDITSAEKAVETILKGNI